MHACDEVYSRRPSWVTGHVSRADARYLYERALQSTADVVVEVGTASGVSTAVLCQALAERGRSGEVISYDTDRRFYADRTRATGDAATEMLSTDLIERIRFRNPATAIEAGEENRDLEFVFIDANHKHPWPALDLLALLPALRSGAEVVLHDINLPLVNPKWQDWGPKYLFDGLRAEKHSDDFSDPPNIGSVVVPSDTDAFRRRVIEIVDGFEWEVDIPESVTLRLLGQRAVP